jgi:L-ribulose-5-phosphate 4-epimerase
MIPVRKYNSIIRDLTTAAERAYRRGMQMGSGGNLSARVPGEDLMVISGSGSSFIDCDVSGAGWVVTDFDAAMMGENNIPPSKESVLHGYLYKHFPEVKSIVHCHSPWVLAWANAADELPFVSWQSTMKLKYPVPVFAQAQPAVSAAECEVIGAALKKMPGFNCFILREHGLVAIGNTAVDAEHQAEFVEECARVAILKKLIGVPLFTGRV